MEGYYTLKDVSKIVQSLWKYCLRKWKLVILCAILGLGLGVGYYFKQEPKYEAATTFILEEKSVAGGGLSGLASQFGLDLGGMGGGGSIFAGDNIFDILRSKKIVQKVLLSKVDDSKGSNSQTLADLFLDFRQWKKKWKPEDLKNINYANVGDTQSLSEKQDSVMNLIHEYLVKKALSADRINKKGSIIKVQITEMNSLFARLMTNRLVDEASKMYLTIRTGTAQANIDRMQRRSDSLLALLNNKSYTAAATQLLDGNPGIKTAGVPLEIAMRDKTVISTVYIEVTKNLEASKMLLAQQTPVIQILDTPSDLMVDKRKGLLKLMVIGWVVGGFLAFAVLCTKFLITASE